MKSQNLLLAMTTGIVALGIFAAPQRTRATPRTGGRLPMP